MAGIEEVHPRVHRGEAAELVFADLELRRGVDPLLEGLGRMEIVALIVQHFRKEKRRGEYGKLVAAPLGDHVAELALAQENNPRFVRYLATPTCFSSVSSSFSEDRFRARSAISSARCLSPRAAWTSAKV